MINVHLSIDDVEALESATLDMGDYNSELSSGNLLGGRDGYNFIFGDLNSSVLGYNNIVRAPLLLNVWWSREASDEHCEFDNPPTIKFTFTRGLKTTGVTLYYLTPWQKAHKVHIKWYYGNTVASEGDYITEERPFSLGEESDSLCYTYPSDCPNATALEISFLESWLPNQTIILRGVALGDVLDFHDEQVISAKYTEVCPEIVETMEYGTCEIDILDEANIFNPSNPGGRWKDLRKYLSVTLTASDDEASIQNWWYLETFEYKEHVLSMKLIDVLGYADTKIFPGCQFINQSFAAITSYIGSMAKIKIGRVLGTQRDEPVDYFMLPECTVREAVQYASLMMGYDVIAQYADKHMTFKLKDYNIRDEIFTNRKFKTDSKFADEVTGIRLNVIDGFTKETNAEEFFSQTMPVGKHRIIFDEPHQLIEVRGATDITGATTFKWVDVFVTTEGTVTLVGKKYNYHYRDYDVAIDKDADTSTYKTFDKIPVNNALTLQEVLDKTAIYYAKRQILTIECAMRSYNAGWARFGNDGSDCITKYACIQSSQDPNQFAYARINKMEVDVTGGFIAKMECRGFSQIVSHDFEMGIDDYEMNDSELI